MKYTAATLAVLAGLVAAHDSPFGDSIPHCAVDCITAGIAAIGCDVSDTACACTPDNLTKLSTDTTLVTCLLSSCTDPADLAAAAEAGTALCTGGSASGSATNGGSDSTATATDTASGSQSSATDAVTTGGSASNATVTTTKTTARPTTSTSASDSEETTDSGSDSEGSDDGSGASTNAVFGGVALLAALLAL